MDWHGYIAWTAILAQLLFVYYALRNYQYVRVKSARRKEAVYRPRTTLIVPCKGLDTRFQSNITSFLRQDYEDYCLFFVVEDESDPAYRELRALLKASPPCVPGDAARDAQHTTRPVQILVSGSSRSSSQKIHNLLYACQRIPEDTEVIAFADSDVCVPDHWLGRLVRPLRRPRCGVTTGYRWFVPVRNNPATLALSALNGAVAQFLGNSPFNHAWGGSMAIRRADFRRLNIAEVWPNTLSDDLSLSQAVKQAGMKITFVPECLVASYESSTWARLLEFGRRQLLITRVYAPVTWWLGFLSSLGSVLGLWGGAVLAVYAAAVHAEHIVLYAAVPCLFLAGQIVRAVLRQLAAAQTLRTHAAQLLPAALADILACWLWSVVLLVLMASSAVGRTIRWRGVRYRLVSPTQTLILNDL